MWPWLDNAGPYSGSVAGPIHHSNLTGGLSNPFTFCFRLEYRAGGTVGRCCAVKLILGVAVTIHYSSSHPLSTHFVVVLVYTSAIPDCAGRSRNDLSGLALSNDNPNGVAMRISVREALGLKPNY